MSGDPRIKEGTGASFYLAEVDRLTGSVMTSRERRAHQQVQESCPEGIEIGFVDNVFRNECHYALHCLS